jgi:methionyl-tRNA synthetase
LLEALHVVAVQVAPFMPESATKILTWLDLSGRDRVPADWQWGAALTPGHLTKPAQVLFPRIELEAA